MPKRKRFFSVDVFPYLLVSRFQAKSPLTTLWRSSRFANILRRIETGTVFYIRNIHIFLLPVKSHSQSLCLVVLLASPSFSGDSPPNTYEEQSIFSIFLISISLWTPSLKLITTISSPDKLIMKVYDNHEDPSVWAGPFLPPDEAGKVADHDFEQHLVWTLKSREEETVYNYVTVAVRSHAHCHNHKCSHLIKLAMKLAAIMSTLLYEHWSRPHWTWRCRSSYWGSATSSSLPISTP